MNDDPLDVTLAWPVTDDLDDEPAAAAATPAPAPARDDIPARLDAIEASLRRLTALVELVVDSLPASAEGSGD